MLKGESLLNALVLSQPVNQDYWLVDVLSTRTFLASCQFNITTDSSSQTAILLH